MFGTTTIATEEVEICYKEKSVTATFPVTARFLDVKRWAAAHFGLTVSLASLKLLARSRSGGWRVSLSPLTLKERPARVQKLRLIEAQPSYAVRNGTTQKDVKFYQYALPPIATGTAFFLDTNVVWYIILLLESSTHEGCQHCAGAWIGLLRAKDAVTELMSDAQRGDVTLLVTETVVREIQRHFPDWETRVKPIKIVSVLSGINPQAKGPMFDHICQVAGGMYSRSDRNDMGIFLEAGALAADFDGEMGLITNNLNFVRRILRNVERIEDIVGEYGITRYIDIMDLSEYHPRTVV